MTGTNLGAVMILATGLALARPAFAVVLGQTDTFEDGTTSNWIINASGFGTPPVGALPVNVATGGPAGANDNFLQLTSLGGSGAGSRLTVNNLAQWTGDYIAVGIGAIAMDLNNLGSTELSLRLLFADPTVGPPTNIAISTAPVILLAGSGWTSVLFPISPADLTALKGSIIGALTNATEIRLFHSVSDAFPGDAIVASLGVDNIQARQTTTVSEPATLALFGLGLAGLGAARGKKLPA